MFLNRLAICNAMIKTIIFDLGNVIVNVNDNELFKDLAAVSGRNTFYVKNYYEGSSARKDFEKGKIDSVQFYKVFSKGLGLKMNFNDFKEAYCNIFNLNINVENLIKKLKKEYRLVLLSNTDELHFEYIKNKFKIVNVFDEYLLSYKLGCRKPNPLIFWKAIKKAKTMPYNCLYFDDIPEFILVARLMGIKAFQYKNFEKLINDLENANIFPQSL